MANLTLLTDPEEMRTVSRAVKALSEDFDGIREGLKTAIGVTLNTECKGDVADEFTKYYNDNIDTKLIIEKETLDRVAAGLLESAANFDDTAAGVKASFN